MNQLCQHYPGSPKWPILQKKFYSGQWEWSICQASLLEPAWLGVPGWSYWWESLSHSSICLTEVWLGWYSFRVCSKGRKRDSTHPWTFQARYESGPAPHIEGGFSKFQGRQFKGGVLLQLHSGQDLACPHLIDILRTDKSSGVKDLTVSWTLPSNGKSKHCPNLYKQNYYF